MIKIEDVILEANNTCERALADVSFPLPAHQVPEDPMRRLKLLGRSLHHVFRGCKSAMGCVEVTSGDNKRKEVVEIEVTPVDVRFSGLHFTTHRYVLRVPEVLDHPEKLVRLLKEGRYLSTTPP